MKIKGSLLVLLVFSHFSCLRLDDNLFNPEEKISQYLWDDYKGNRELADLPDSFSIEKRHIQFFFLKSKGEKIACVYLGDTNQIAGKKVILYCHGNKNHMDNYWNRAKLLYHLFSPGIFGVLMMDYRGYGLSTGKPTENSLYEDVATCMEWLHNKGLKRTGLTIYGYSLGSAPATKLASDSNFFETRNLILEAPFASAQAMISDASKLQLPASYFTNLKIDNASEIKKVKAPLLWLHGKKDDFLDSDNHGEVVFQNAREPKIAVRVENAGHNDIPQKLGYQNYLLTIESFLKE